MMLPTILQEELQLDIRYKELYVWSDGGMKSNNNLATFSILSRTNSCRVICNFFAPHHGHCVVDGHFGVGKKQLRNDFAPPNQITMVEEVLNSWQKLQKTRVVYLPQINPIQFQLVKPLSGIRRWFQVAFEPRSPWMTYYDKSSPSNCLGRQKLDIRMKV
jgi:hypothetical protein